MRPWIPAILWADAIFILSSMPGSFYPHTRIFGADKIVHFALYATMGALCARALLLGPSRRTGGDPAKPPPATLPAAAPAPETQPATAPPPEATIVRPPFVVLAIAAGLAALYGISDELHQLVVPGRSADWRDALTDAIGAVVGAGAAVALRLWSRRPAG